MYVRLCFMLQNSTGEEGVGGTACLAWFFNDMVWRVGHTCWRHCTCYLAGWNVLDSIHNPWLVILLTNEGRRGGWDSAEALRLCGEGLLYTTDSVQVSSICSVRLGGPHSSTTVGLLWDEHGNHDNVWESVHGRPRGQRKLPTSTLRTSVLGYRYCVSVGEVFNVCDGVLAHGKVVQQ